ncbi:hypothetical protein TrRE_jg13300 [Triparma retinervis]|uniref:Tyrosine-protein kinase ephrin type A/B receptor-like domain-containing protein n=1 Tax=Triparma retinervis TaxID=2557542 RepID=A0A9W7E0P2_9STRA|nr:hypothetical protein TrRE_jg13300 [Triparma retinervis]
MRPATLFSPLLMALGLLVVVRGNLLRSGSAHFNPSQQQQQKQQHSPPRLLDGVLACSPGSGKANGTDACEICPEGKFSNVTGPSTCTDCPDDFYCASGSASPVACPTNHSLICNSNDECPEPLTNSFEPDEAHVCVDYRCTSLTSKTGYCYIDTVSLRGTVEVIKSKPQQLNEEVCQDLFIGGFREEGEIGCPTGSICARWKRVEAKLNSLYALNQADAILEIIGGVITIVYVGANYLNYNLTSMWFNRLNVFVFMALDVVLQISVLSISNDSSIMETLTTVQSASCWLVTSDATATMIDLTSSFDWVNVLGWLELGVVCIALSSALQDRLKEEEDQKEDRSIYERIGLIISILAIFFDIILSSMDFFLFTMNTHTAYGEISATLYEEEFYTTVEVTGADGFPEMQFRSTSNMPKCQLVQPLFPANPYTPTPIISPANCMEKTIVVDYGSKSWIIWLTILLVCWVLGISGMVYYRRKYPSAKGILMTKAEMQIELTEKRDEVRRRQESNGRKDVEIARQKAEIEALRKEKEALAKAKANTDARERRASSSSKKEANLKKREEEMRAKGDIVKTKSAGALI